MIGQPTNRLEDHGHLLVRRAVLRDDWISDALLDLAADGQTDWTPKQWDTLLTELQSSTLNIRDWIVLYT